jgi:hypothetical protein
MRTQADDLNSEKRNLISMMNKIEQIGHKDSDMYKYYQNRYYNVVSTLDNIR